MKTKENEIGEQFNPKTASCRDMNIIELHQIVCSSGLTRAGSWGFKNGVVELKNKSYRFTVNGRHHKGHVHIVLNGLDLFDIYYTTKNNVITKIDKDIYVFDLIETLDKSIEYISDYIR
jgi:hypothetical protein